MLNLHKSKRVGASAYVATVGEICDATTSENYGASGFIKRETGNDENLKVVIVKVAYDGRDTIIVIKLEKDTAGQDQVSKAFML